MRQPTHYLYEGRNVMFNSQRHRKIQIWEYKKALRKALRQAKRQRQ